MNVEALSRLQFAVVAIFHFFFVPLTLGLSVLVAYMETRYVRTGDETFLRMAKFWGKLFIINFAVGVVTGITLEFQFGMNWAGYANYVGDIFGAPLAIEATVAFFLESTFIGLWIFGWKRLSKRAHAAVIWVVAFASSLSALWILIANGWMQHPVGYAIENGRAVMTNFGALLTNSYGWTKFAHTVLAGYVLAAFFVMGISAFHILRKSDNDFFKKSFRISATFGLVCSVLLIVAGDLSGLEMSRYQPTKLAAVEAQWHTETAAPFYLIQIPDPAHDRNLIQALPIPKGLSLVAFHNPNATITGLLDFPAADRPPVMINFIAFRLMIALGFLFVLLAAVSFYLSRKDMLEQFRWFLWVMLISLFLPYVAAQLGWIVSEIGRQPWIVYNMLSTRDAVSRSITTADVLISLIGFVVLYGTLLVVDVFLLTKYSKKFAE
ncbi:MAG TPA: cytochrome ubiquinol oxidase subunit I [Spirochaetia bacterium]|nr:cytochrome ubiquinol oxidase subunit I [Spirochaetia bacterium]